MNIRVRYDYPIEVTLDVVCGKWKGVILCKLLDNTLRFGELKNEIPHISQKMLTEQLRELEEDQLVNRVVYNQVPPKVEYSLTAYGQELRPTLTLLNNWGKNHINLVEEAKQQDNVKQPE
ncbi:MAG TPA: helix-turn-helix domain-containing protein [Pseudogracilibacillus sp.]|nr:helix-turn-helix domain-containing protein [Pseudogracilibacillus sp.]